MRCHICNTKIDHPETHPITGEWEPCGNCLSTIKRSDYADVDDFLNDGGEISDEDLLVIENFFNGS